MTSCSAPSTSMTAKSMIGLSVGGPTAGSSRRFASVVSGTRMRRGWDWVDAVLRVVGRLSLSVTVVMCEPSSESRADG